jgi:predicted RNase H-like HicB family nuclease
MKTEQENLEYYLQLPYTVVLRRDEERDWVAGVQELDGCTAHGGTQAEALENLEDVQRAWIEDALEAGDDIPEPAEETPLPSGKWLQRVPRTLHRKLADTAKREGVSLNQLVASILAEAVGRRASVTTVRTGKLADVKDQLEAYVSEYLRAATGARRSLHTWSQEWAAGPDWEIDELSPPGYVLLAENLVTSPLTSSRELIDIFDTKVSKRGQKEERRHKGYTAAI